MTDTQDLAARLRKDAPRHYDGQLTALMDEAADALEASQAEIERHESGPLGKKYYEEASYTLQAERDTAQRELDAALARLAGLEKQPIFGFHWRKGWEWGFSLTGDFKASDKSSFTPLYAAAGASPVQPSQAGEWLDYEQKAEIVSNWFSDEDMQSRAMQMLGDIKQAINVKESK